MLIQRKDRTVSLIRGPSAAAAPDRPSAQLSKASLGALAATSRPILVTDATLPDNPIVYSNPAFSLLTGYQQDEVLGRNCRFLQGADTDAGAKAEIGAAVSAGTAIRREILNYKKDGTPFWNDLTIDPIHDEAGRLTGFIGVQHDAGALHLAAEQQKEVEARLAAVTENIPGYVYRRVMRTDGRIEVVYLSPSMRNLVGTEEGDFTSAFYAHVHPDDRDTLYAAIRESAASMTTFREEFRLIAPDGVTHWLRSDAKPRQMPNGEIVWDGVSVEIGAEKRWENEIAAQALRDPLTGLLSRTAGGQALTIQLGSGSSCGFLHIDIKTFSDVNDRLGHTVGDEVLRQAAQRIGAVAASVSGAAARLGSDEFAMMVPGCRGGEALLTIADKVCAAFAESIPTRAGPVSIAACIGASFKAAATGDASAGKDAAEALATEAEVALRLSKQSGCGSPVLYSTDEDDRFRNRAILSRSLQRAIADNELELHYQPLVELTSGRIVSAEALVRWNHPTLGMQRPDLFIPLAEESGLIVPLGHWVLEEAFRHRKLWTEAGLSIPPIALNVSAVQLLDPDFVPSVERALKAWDANPSDFEIELTEGLLIEPTLQVMSSLHVLRDMGFAMTIDDFGSGNATFRYLRDFPVDKLKIDQVFVRQLVRESTDALIIRAVISLARGMGIGFVAEGVETETQLDFLIREGCLIGQGYYFSMPLVAEDYAWMLANDVRLPIRPRMIMAPQTGNAS